MSKHLSLAIQDIHQTDCHKGHCEWSHSQMNQLSLTEKRQAVLASQVSEKSQHVTMFLLCFDFDLMQVRELNPWLIQYQTFIQNMEYDCKCSKVMGLNSASQIHRERTTKVESTIFKQAASFDLDPKSNSFDPMLNQIHFAKCPTSLQSSSLCQQCLTCHNTHALSLFVRRSFACQRRPHSSLVASNSLFSTV